MSIRGSVSDSVQNIGGSVATWTLALTGWASGIETALRMLSFASAIGVSVLTIFFMLKKRKEGK